MLFRKSTTVPMIDTVTFKNRKRRILTNAGTDGSPLVVVLPSAYTTIEKMVELISPEKFAPWHVLMPEAVVQLSTGLPRWDDNPLPFYSRGIPDVDFIQFAIARAQASLKTGPVFLVGFSNGSFMVHRFLHQARNPGITAAATVSGALLNEYVKCNYGDWALTPPVPMLMFNGTDDNNVPYNGETGVMSAPETAAYYATKLGAAAAVRSSVPDCANDGTTPVVDQFQLGDRPGVTFYTIQNGGHTWPGSTQNVAALGKVCMDFDATLLIRDWFAVWAAPATAPNTLA